MRIKLTDSIFIEQCAYAPNNWDMYYMYSGMRKGEQITVEKPLGCYGLTLTQLITKIADYELQLSEEEALDLKTYVEKFEKIQKEAIESIKESIKQLKLK